MACNWSDLPPTPDPVRHSVVGLQNNAEGAPGIVSISDIHGYLDAARTALLTLDEHPDYEPVVRLDADNRLRWADENYVLVFNGDLIDRGPANDGVLEMVRRLTSEAPPGRVRVTLGNHEAMMLTPEYFQFGHSWYSTNIDTVDRRAFLSAILAGHVVAAYDGYHYTYAHAGAATTYTAPAVNQSLCRAAETIRDELETGADSQNWRDVIQKHSDVLGVGTDHVKGPDAGLVWLDFSHLPSDAPPQIVGHTKHRSPTRKGNVICENVTRANLDENGGESVLVEYPDSLVALSRTAAGNVTETSFTQ